MKVRHSKKPLPRDWRCLPGVDRAVLVRDIAVTRGSRLRMKLLVFRNNRDLCWFWRYGLDRSPLCRRTFGVVSDLSFEVISFKKGGNESRHLRVDPRYFAVMGLIRKAVNVEVVCHEAMHVGFAYARRRGFSCDVWPGAKDMPEENICYPAGRIANNVALALKRAGL